MAKASTPEGQPSEHRSVPNSAPAPYLVARAGKREQSLRRVEKVALAMFAQDGFDGVTVEQICAEAQIGPATFYRYFGSKEGVIFRYEESFLAVASAAGRSVNPHLPHVEQLRDVLCRCSVFFETQSEIRVVRDEIVLANVDLLKHTFAVERRFENALAQALATARRESEPTSGTTLDAAICMLVLRLALTAWRYQDDSSLPNIICDTYESLRSRLSEPMLS